jgi:hypothetical protein
MMITAKIVITAMFDPEELPIAYTNEEELTEAITDWMECSLDRLYAEDVVVNSIDIEGME